MSSKKLAPLYGLVFLDSLNYFIVIPVLLKLFFETNATQFNFLPHDTSFATRSFLTEITLILSPLAALIASPLLGYSSDLYGRKKTLTYCLSFISLGFLLPIFGILKQSLFLILLGRLLAGVGSASQPIAQACIADIIPIGSKAKFFSLMALMMTLPIFIGPLIGNLLSSYSFTLISSNGLITPYVFTFILSLLNLFLLIFFFRPPHQNQQNQQNQRSHVSALKLLIHTPVLLIYGLIFIFLELSWSAYYQSIAIYLTHVFTASVNLTTGFYTYLGLWMSAGLLFLYPLLISYLKLSLKKILKLSLFFIFLGSLLCFLGDGVILTQWLFSPLISLFTGVAYVALISLISDASPPECQGLMLGFTSTLLFTTWLITGLIAGGLLSIYIRLPLLLTLLFSLAASLTSLIQLKNKK